MSAHLIDDVARRMTDVAPPVDLRVRVVAQLADRPARWQRWQPLTAAAAIVVVASIAVFVHRGGPISPNAITPAVAAPTVAHVDAAGLAPSSTTSGAPRRVRRAATKPEVISPAELAWRARAIPAIATEAPLSAADIQPATLQLPLLEVKPLVNAPVIVAPIAVADASGGR